MVVYLITNLINGKKYIGTDSKNNPKYLGSGDFIKKAIIKIFHILLESHIFIYVNIKL